MAHFKTLIFFAAFIYGVLSIKVPDIPEKVPHSLQSISAFRKNYLSSISEELPTGSLYNGKSHHAMVVRNVEFGVFGAKNVTVGFNLQKEATKSDVEFRIDGENGQLISKLKMPNDWSSEEATATAMVTPVKGYHDLYISYSANKGNLSWFQFEVAGPNPEEYYVLTSLNNGRAIGSQGFAVNAHTVVEPYTYGLHQMLRFTKTPYGSYYITNRKTEYNLDIKPEQVFNDTVYLYQNVANANQSQEWYIDTTGDGSVKIMSRASGRCATIISGLHLAQIPCRNETTQKWYFMPVC